VRQNSKREKRTVASPSLDLHTDTFSMMPNQTDLTFENHATLAEEQ
jgi:hypothetical protein